MLPTVQILFLLLAGYLAVEAAQALHAYRKAQVARINYMKEDLARLQINSQKWQAHIRELGQLRKREVDVAELLVTDQCELIATQMKEMRPPGE